MVYEGNIEVYAWSPRAFLNVRGTEAPIESYCNDATAGGALNAGGYGQALA